MLGNFSFGDYFKKDAIAYAWELITSKDWFGIDKDKLYVTIFDDPDKAAASWELGFDVERDHEAEKYWLEVGIPKERTFPGGRKDSFWQMGDTGPCGPCSEIHYDMGPAASDQGHTDCKFGCECGRYVEIWNLVFMQYDRDATGTKPLPKPSIDTGMGLQRVTAVLQGVISNYDTDLFTPLIKRAAELTLGGHAATAELRSAGQPGAAVPTQAKTNTVSAPGRGHVGTAAWAVRAGQSPAAGSSTAHVETGAPARQAEQSSAGSPSHKSAASLRVIADHSRAATFLISDGVLPSNEGRGYVLRKIIRRAITHGRLLEQTKPFLHEMVFAVRDLMQDAYPELNETADRVSKTVHVEETRFAHTLDVGLERLEALLERAEKGWRFSGSTDDAVAALVKETGGTPSRSAIDDFRARDRRLPGDEAFKLYDTFGMPRDFIQDATRDRGIIFDQAGFDQAMEEQKIRARASWKGAAKQTANPAYQQLPKSVFEGYRQTRSDNCEVLAIVHNGRGVQQLTPGDEGEVILDHTPFYAESGGQVGDRGWLYSDDHNTIIAEVKGCYSPIH